MLSIKKIFQNRFKNVLNFENIVFFRFLREIWRQYILFFLCFIFSFMPLKLRNFVMVKGQIFYSLKGSLFVLPKSFEVQVRDNFIFYIKSEPWAFHFISFPLEILDPDPHLWPESTEWDHKRNKPGYSRNREWDSCWSTWWWWWCWTWCWFRDCQSRQERRKRKYFLHRPSHTG